MAHQKKIPRYCFALAILLLALTAGCATTGHQAHPGKGKTMEEAGLPERGWWTVSFRMAWPEDATPAWHVDALLAGRIISPVLDSFRKDILLWRFHRRAVRDAAGHKFSFLFYSKPKTAGHIFDAIRRDDTLSDLIASGVVQSVNYDDTSKINRPGVEDTSDKNWSEPIQRSWPYFIMGVSEMWLGLISQYAAKCPSKSGPASVEEISECYLAANDFIEESWRKEGGHAFLHHLNALFGYAPLMLNGKQLWRF